MFNNLYFMATHEIAKRIIDKRKRPQISLDNILGLLSIGISQNNVSNHHLDISGRIEINKSVAKSNRRMVCSDTQLERILSNFLEMPEDLPYRIYCQMKPYLPFNPGKRILIIDGTVQSKRLYSIGAIHSVSPFFIGMEKQEKHGKELNASEDLIRRLAPLWINEFDLIVGDGLYFNVNDFKTALEFGKHFFVKSREENLQIIQETEIAYKLEKASFWISRKEKIYLDIDRKISYKVFVYRNFQYQDLKKPLQCYRVEETSLRDGKQEIFYCITTADNLSPAEARDIAKQRWQIENNVFRLGNQACRTKRQYFRQEPTNRKYLFLIYLLLSILYALYVIGQYRKILQARNMNFTHFIRYWVIFIGSTEKYQIQNSG